ncbi:Hypothetical protein R9X50_00497800 [Acrodontium crateriforme]|uniref:Uncharacterized protein n=1 Tax=Acrodontium crateriforme TaxID=150365 RepID=A0AAQ3M8J0_9PEZI|nr:Hypothetical protein R9X50_00497800 [Acrodontium crateriforme]
MSYSPLCRRLIRKLAKAKTRNNRGKSHSIFDWTAKAPFTRLQLSNTLSKSNESTSTSVNMALHVLMQINVACVNTIHDLEMLDGLTDNWNVHAQSKDLIPHSLAISLHCQFAAEESKAISDIMNDFLSEPAQTTKPMAIFAELHVRQENIMAELSGLKMLVEQLYVTFVDVVELSLAEIVLRAQRLCVRMEELKGKITVLEGYAHKPSTVQPQNTDQSPDKTQSPAPQLQTE